MKRVAAAGMVMLALATGCAGNGKAGGGRMGSTPAPVAVQEPAAREDTVAWDQPEPWLRLTRDPRAVEEARRLARGSARPPAEREGGPVTASPYPEQARALALLRAGGARDEAIALAARMPAGQARPVRWALAGWGPRDGYRELGRLGVIPDESPREEAARGASREPWEELDALLVANRHAVWARAEAGAGFLMELAGITRGGLGPQALSVEGAVLRVVLDETVFEVQEPDTYRLVEVGNRVLSRGEGRARLRILENGLVIFADADALPVALDCGLLAPELTGGRTLRSLR